MVILASAMSLVGISNKRTQRGVRAPGFEGETWDWRRAAGSARNSGRVRANYRVMPAIDAVSTAFDFDAYMVPYSLVAPDGQALSKQPRVSADALPWLHRQGYTVQASCLFVDIDNPNRRPWAEEDRERAHVEHALIPMLATVGICSTPYGRRLIQPLDRALDVETFARTARAFALALDLAGVIGVDHRCCDWTRHYRLANGLRKGRRESPWWFDLSRMSPIPLPTPVAAIPRRQKAPKGTIGYLAPVEPTWSTAVAHRYRPLIGDLAEALAAFRGDARAALRAVGGALCERGVPVEHVPRMIAGVAIDAHKVGLDTHAVDDAYRTIRRWQENKAVRGLRVLRDLDPRIADLAERHTPSASEQRLFTQMAAACVDAPLPTAIEIAQIGVERTIDGATGVEVVEVGGVIETSEAARRVALMRSQREPAAPDTGAALPGQRTMISCATPAAAMNQTERLRREGARVLRVFSPLSVLREDGSPECRFHEAGKVLEAAGLVVSREFCGGPQSRRCEYWEECAARSGADPDEGARIVVGDHLAIARHLHDAATDNLLIVDEPSDPIAVVSFTAAEVDACLGHAAGFLPHLWTLTLPLVFATRAALASGAFTRTDGVPTVEELCAIAWRDVPEAPIREALGLAGDLESLDGIGTMARVFAALRRALSEDAELGAVLLHPDAVRVARDAQVAVRLARAASLVRALSQGALHDPPASIRITDFNGRRSVTIARVAPEFSAALRRAGPTVLLATNLTLPHAIAELVMKAPVPRHRFASPDVAPSRREVWLEPKARRTHWLKKGAGRWPDWEKGPVRAVQRIVAYAMERFARRVGIITVPSVAVALRVALGEVPPPEMPAEEVELARRWLTPVFTAAANIQWTIGHYGELASLPPMTSCGGLVTLMDPMPDVGVARHAAAFCSSTIPLEQYVDAVTSAALERAHELALHARRFGSCWAVHIGATLPGGYGWDQLDMVVGRMGQPRARGAMTVDELRAIKGSGTIRALAAAIGVKENTLTRYFDGSRKVPLAVAELLRNQGVANGRRVQDRADSKAPRRI